MTQSSSVTVDPTTLATVWHHLQTTCREMRHLLERTCQNYLIGQLRDVSVGLWGADGQMLAAPLGMPNQFMGTGLALQAVYKRFGDDIHPGDVILTNDPYGAHCPHLPDWGFIRPIFYGDELLFFTMVRGHQEDTGGSYPGGYFPNGYDIHAEGIRIPPIKVFDRDKERTDVLDFVWHNVRFPHGIRIDNYAMIAATKLAEDRMLVLLDRYGRDTVVASLKEMVDRIERAVREDIRKIPDGTYHGESATDDDGTVLDEPVWVRVDITVKDDEVTLDFTESDKQRRGFVNMIYAASYSQSVAAVLCMLDPELSDYHNEGSLRPIKIINPPGTVINAQYPATVGASPVNVGTQVMEAVLEAMSKARPSRAQAAWGKHRGDYVFGNDPRTSEPYVRTSFDYDGSAGAVWGYDGPHGPCVQVSLASIRRGNIEEMEVRVPWRMQKFELATDLMGAGCWRGGGGILWEAVNEGGEAGMATGSSDGDQMLGYGALGGNRSPACRTFLVRGSETIHLKPHRMYQLQKGDIVLKRSAGGGGVGPPEERDPESVRNDVLNELISVEAARDLYKVVVHRETLEIDREETRRLRG
ncbi:MAG: hydantoinase B/oxoprolinase family protein [Candidatus Methylomirabilales bacterium]